MVKEAKKNNWQKKIEEINEDPNSKNTWSFINNVNGSRKHNPNIWSQGDNSKYLDWLQK